MPRLLLDFDVHFTQFFLQFYSNHAAILLNSFQYATFFSKKLQKEFV